MWFDIQLWPSHLVHWAFPEKAASGFHVYKFFCKATLTYPGQEQFLHESQQTLGLLWATVWKGSGPWQFRMESNCSDSTSYFKNTLGRILPGTWLLNYEEAKHKSPPWGFWVKEVYPLILKHQARSHQLTTMWYKTLSLSGLGRWFSEWSIWCVSMRAWAQIPNTHIKPAMVV